MKIFTKFIAAALVYLGASLSASGDIIITPDTGVLNDTRFQGTEWASTSVLRGIVAGITGGLPELWKAEVGDEDDPTTTYEGPLSGSYTASFSNTALDPSDVLIEYVGGAVADQQTWLVIKDGRHAPYWYVFNLTALGWDGTEAISVSGFWPNGGAISHVALVPEPGTLALLGLGLLGFGLSRRGRSAH